MNESTTSEVARLRRQIELEYQASRRVFSEFTPHASHDYITRRQENIAACYRRLTQLVSAQEALSILMQAEQVI